MRRLTIREINSRKPPDSRLTAKSLFRKWDGNGFVGYCKAICICGTEIEIGASRVATGKTRSCGCIAKEGDSTSSFTIKEMNERKKSQKGSRLVAIKFIQKTKIKGRSVRNVLVRCKCGNEKELCVAQFLSDTKSCGCLLKENGTIKWKNNCKEIDGCYRAMMARCYNPKWNNYYNYGGRGVKVCDEWINDYQSFLNWARKNGWAKGLQLDKDSKGDGLLYSPETCCFLTARENMSKRRNSFKYQYNGKEMTLTEILDSENFAEGSHAITNLRARVFKNGKERFYRCSLFILEIEKENGKGKRYLPAGKMGMPLMEATRLNQNIEQPKTDQ